MASAKAKIRHVFGDTFSCRAAPPDILVKLSGFVAMCVLQKCVYLKKAVFSYKLCFCQKCVIY